MFLRNTACAAAFAAAVLTVPTVAPAATVTIGLTYYAGGAANLEAARTARDAFVGGGTIISEDFEGFTACTTRPGTAPNVCDSGTINTAVGQFTGITPTFSGGGSQVNPTNQIVVRTASPDPYGRFNTDGTDRRNWLDSNDMNGISWLVPGDATLNAVRRLAFFLTDVDDVGTVNFTLRAIGEGGAFNVIVNRTEALLPGGVVDETVDPVRLRDSRLHLVTMEFDAPVSNFEIRMVNGPGDGNGLDGVQMSVVPLPAAGLLLLGALGGLGLLRRRRTAA